MNDWQNLIWIARNCTSHVNWINGRNLLARISRKSSLSSVSHHSGLWLMLFISSSLASCSSRRLLRCRRCYRRRLLTFDDFTQFLLRLNLINFVALDGVWRRFSCSRTASSDSLLTSSSPDFVRFEIVMRKFFPFQFAAKPIDFTRDTVEATSWK